MRVMSSEVRAGFWRTGCCFLQPACQKATADKSSYQPCRTERLAPGPYAAGPQLTKEHAGHITRRGIKLTFYPPVDRGHAHHFPVARPLPLCKGRAASTSHPTSGLFTRCLQVFRFFAPPERSPAVWGARRPRRLQFFLSAFHRSSYRRSLAFAGSAGQHRTWHSTVFSCAERSIAYRSPAVWGAVRRHMTCKARLFLGVPQSWT